jgi:hypothetical protein
VPAVDSVTVGVLVERTREAAGLSRRGLADATGMEAMREALLHFLELDDYLDEQDPQASAHGFPREVACSVSVHAGRGTRKSVRRMVMDVDSVGSGVGATAGGGITIPLRR